MRPLSGYSLHFLGFRAVQDAGQLLGGIGSGLSEPI